MILQQPKEFHPGVAAGSDNGDSDHDDLPKEEKGNPRVSLFPLNVSSRKPTGTATD
jgi:hypothetical protein